MFAPRARELIDRAVLVVIRFLRPSWGGRRRLRRSLGDMEINNPRGWEKVSEEQLSQFGIVPGMLPPDGGPGPRAVGNG